MGDYFMKHGFSSIKFVIVATLITIFATIPASHLAAASPYSAGYDHGFDDAKISNADDRYINQPDKRPSQHTSEFMSGYNAGFSSCGGSNSGGDNSGSSDTGQTRSSLVDKVCNFAQTNPTAAAAAATLLGYPGLDSAVRAVCSFR
jgi:hypothetical protein